MLLQVLFLFDFLATEPAGNVLVSREVHLFVLSEPALGSKGLFTLITWVGVVGRTMPLFMEGECGLVCKVFAAVLALVRGHLQVFCPHMCPKPLSIVALMATHRTLFVSSHHSLNQVLHILSIVLLTGVHPQAF